MSGLRGRVALAISGVVLLGLAVGVAWHIHGGSPGEPAGQENVGNAAASTRPVPNAPAVVPNKGGKAEVPSAKSDVLNPGPLPEDDLPWESVETLVEGKKYAFSCIKYAEPRKVRSDLPSEKWSQRTVEGCADAFASSGKTVESLDDLKAHLERFCRGTALTYKAQMAMIGGAARWQEIRKTVAPMENRRLLGKIRYGRYLIVVDSYSFKGDKRTWYGGAPYIYENGAYYKVAKSDLTGKYPFFMHMSQDDYSIITGVTQ
jgi:hypothetical protein